MSVGMCIIFLETVEIVPCTLGPQLAREALTYHSGWVQVFFEYIKYLDWERNTDRGGIVIFGAVGFRGWVTLGSEENGREKGAENLRLVLKAEGYGERRDFEDIERWGCWRLVGWAL